MLSLLPALLACAAPSSSPLADGPGDSRLRPAASPAATADPTLAARVLVDRWYVGSATTTSAIGPATAVGDVDGDGFPDVLLGAGSRVYVYPGGALGPSPNPSHVIVVPGASSLGSSIAFLGDVNGDGYGDFVSGATSGAGAAHVFYGSDEGPSTSASDWSTTGAESGEALGSTVAAAGDVDGDGHDDLLVGSARYDGSRTDQGRAQLFLGSAAGLETTASWTVTGGQTSAMLGHALVGAGDVDGDGYDDVLVGAYGYDDGMTDQGAAWLYHGSATGLSTTAGWSRSVDQERAYTGIGLGAMGDLDGDGYDDVVVGSSGYDGGHNNEGIIELFTGSASGLSTEPEDDVEGNANSAAYGESFLAGPDLDGDGVGDLVVQSSFTLYVHLNSSAGLDGSADLSFVGASPGGAGDVDADGYDDLFWGYDLYSTVAVYMQPGGPDGPMEDPTRASFVTDSYTDQMGLSVADAGDLDGDGYGELIIGDVYTPVHAAGTPDGYAWAGMGFIGSGSGAAGAGAVGDVDGDGYGDVIVGTSSSCYLYYGSVDGPRDYLSIAGSGTAVAAGDFDDDGYPDFAVGQGASSRVDVWLGSDSGVSSAYDLRLSGTGSSRFGAGLAVGDFDGDGYDDLAVGAPQATTTLSGEGRATVYPGSASGLSTVAETTLVGGVASGGCGGVGAGDVDGDGYDDLLLACPSLTTDEAGEGQVRMYPGSASGLSTTVAWNFEGLSPGDEAGAALAVADFTGDGYADVALHLPGDDSFFDEDTGYVALFVGGPGGLADEPDLVFVGPYVGWGVDNTLAAVSPADGDGTMDLAWGVPLTSGYGGSGVWVYDLDDSDGDGDSRFFDCDDDDPDIGPLGVEVENGRDDDCNGVVDDLPTWWYLDDDGDGYGDDTTAVDSDEALEGRVLVGGDCDDGDPEAYPGGEERCDGDDDDCDGEIDEAGAADGAPMHPDMDGDGFGLGLPTTFCSPEEGWAGLEGDCDDESAAVYPGAPEYCNDMDDDCDGLIDGVMSVDVGTWYTDADMDGYGDPDSEEQGCEQPEGTVEDATDCDDGDGSIHPGATELCDAADTDEDCDSVAEEAGAVGESTWYADLDGDGFGDVAAPGLACDAPVDAVADATDCDDEDALVHPEAAELCDAFDTDEDCDGQADDLDGHATGTATWYRDGDGDGYGDAEETVQACDEVDGYVGDGTDCDDAALATHPGAEEVPGDGIDQDCDGEDAIEGTGDGGATDGGATDGGGADGGSVDGGGEELEGEGSKACATVPPGGALGGLLVAVLAGLRRRRRRR